jgi:hypothetical protein
VDSSYKIGSFSYVYIVDSSYNIGSFSYGKVSTLHTILDHSHTAKFSNKQNTETTVRVNPYLNETRGIKLF